MDHNIFFEGENKTTVIRLVYDQTQQWTLTRDFLQTWYPLKLWYQEVDDSSAFSDFFCKFQLGDDDIFQAFEAFYDSDNFKSTAE